MYLYVFRYEEWLTLYNCSFYDTESLAIGERQHKSAGMLTLLMFGIFEFLYIPCLCIITGDSFRRLSCYKLMALLGLLDVTIMPLNMAISAVFAIRGDMYCTHPTLTYAVGLAVTALWPAHVTTSAVLALNRCLVVAAPDLARTLFEGRRTYVWFLAPLAAGFTNSFFFKTLMYNGVLFAYVSDPHLGYFNDYGTRYVNQFHFATNVLGFTALPAIYGIFLVMLAGKAGGLRRLTSHSQYSSFIQVALLAVLQASVCLVYIYFQFYPAPPFLCMLGTFGWFCIHGAPALVYLTLNSTVRSALVARAKVVPGVGAAFPVSTTQTDLSLAPPTNENTPF